VREVLGDDIQVGLRLNGCYSLTQTANNQKSCEERLASCASVGAKGRNRSALDGYCMALGITPITM